MSDAKGKKVVLVNLLRGIVYLLAAGLVFTVFTMLCNVPYVAVESADEGPADLRTINFQQDIAEVTIDAAIYYYDAFYYPEDFAAGMVQQEGVRGGKPDDKRHDYGTVRFLLRLPADEILSLSAKSYGFSQRLFINGAEFPSIGHPADNAEDIIPKTTRYVAAFQPADGVTEIIIHYANFVHASSGGFHSITIGSVPNIARGESLKMIQAFAGISILVAVALVFLGLFLFASKNRYFLWYAMICICLALRGLLVADKPIRLLLPNLDWYVALRLEYLATYGAVLCFALLISSLFTIFVNKWVLRGYIAFCLGLMAFVCIAPTVVFSRYVFFEAAVIVSFFVYFMIACLLSALRRKEDQFLRGAERNLSLTLLFGFLILATCGFFAHQYSFLLGGQDFVQTVFMFFLFGSILALALGYFRTESELDEARRSEREMEETNQMLQRLDVLKTKYLANISHELRTPLTVMSGYAQLTAKQIEAGSADEESRDNLRIISEEAQRLANLATDLLNVTTKETVLERKAINISAVVEPAGAIARTILAKNNNRLLLSIEENLPLVYASGDRVQQVLLNLLINANQHTRSGTVTIAVSRQETQGEAGWVQVTVADTGEGMDSALVTRALERGISGRESSGIGLAICKEIVEAHGGTLSIHSAMGEGTSVSFTLPPAGESEAKK